jgi:hypothetical protein
MVVDAEEERKENKEIVAYFRESLFQDLLEGSK